MRLFIAEKPNMAREIAKNLPGTPKASDSKMNRPAKIRTICQEVIAEVSLQRSKLSMVEKERRAFSAHFDCAAWAQQRRYRNAKHPH